MSDKKLNDNRPQQFTKFIIDVMDTRFDEQDQKFENQTAALEAIYEDKLETHRAYA